MTVIAHHFAAGVYAKQQHLPAGFTAQTHKHAHDHLSILASGRARVIYGYLDHVEYEAPACVLIKKGISHSIHAVTACDWFCVHATEETNPERIDETLIEQGA